MYDGLLKMRCGYIFVGSLLLPPYGLNTIWVQRSIMTAAGLYLGPLSHNTLATNLVLFYRLWQLVCDMHIYWHYVDILYQKDVPSSLGLWSRLYTRQINRIISCCPACSDTGNSYQSRSICFVFNHFFCHIKKQRKTYLLFIIDANYHIYINFNLMFMALFSVWSTFHHIFGIVFLFLIHIV